MPYYVMQYEEGVYATIELDSGERIRLSVAQTGIAIFEMRFFGVVRKRTIAEWNPSQVNEFMYKLGMPLPGEAENMTPFRYTVLRLTQMKSIKALEEYLNLPF